MDSLGTGMSKFKESYNNSITKEQVLTIIERCLSAAATTPNFCWDAVEYKRGIADPYNVILHLRDKLEREDSVAEFEQVVKALVLLGNILSTKKLPSYEQLECYDEIFADFVEDELLIRLKNVLLKTA